MSRVDSHQPGSTIASVEECRLCGREGMDNSVFHVEPQYCPVCIEELGHYLRSEATQPTNGHDERLLNNLKSLLGGSSLVSIRVSVVAQEGGEAPVLASVGNLLGDVQRLTLFQCNTQALLTTVMEGMYADSWRPVRDHQVDVVHALMHTHQKHKGAFFFSLPIRCEDDAHMGSPDCAAVGLLTLGWSTVPRHIPRVMPTVRAVVAAMGCGFGAAVKDLVHDVTTYFLPSAAFQPSLVKHGPWDGCSTDGQSSDKSDGGSPPGVGVRHSEGSGTHEERVCDGDVTWDPEWENPGDPKGKPYTWGPCDPGTPVSCGQGEGGPSSVLKDDQLCSGKLSRPGWSVLLSGEWERRTSGGGEGAVSPSLRGDRAEGGILHDGDKAGLQLPEDDGECASCSKQGPADCVMGEKQSRSVSKQGVAHPPQRLARQSALWLTFDDPELEARFLAYQAARAMTLSLCVGFLGVGTLLLVAWRDAAVGASTAIAVAIVTLTSNLAMRMLPLVWSARNHEIMAVTGNAIMTAIMGWHMMVITASPSANPDANAHMAYRRVIISIFIQACSDLAHKLRHKVHVLIKTPILLPITIFAAQHFLMLGCRYTPSAAFALSATCIAIAHIAMHAVMRKRESKDRAHFLSTVSLQS